MAIGESVTLADGSLADSPLVALLRPFDIEVDRPFVLPATLHAHVDPGVVNDAGTVFIASFDSTSGDWQPVGSSFDPSTGIVSAEVSHFSTWAVLMWARDRLLALGRGIVQSIFGPALKHPGDPVCPTPPTGVTANETTDANDAVRFCSNDAGGTSIELRLVNTRAYPVDVAFPKGAGFVADDDGSAAQRVGAALNSASSQRPSLRLLPPRAQARVTFALSAGASATVGTQLDGEALLVSVLDVGLQEAAIIYAKLAKGGEAGTRFVDSLLKHLDTAKCLNRTISELVD
ncbi:MAG: hypothetical protein M3256_22700, partial [Actinomycetota bacterium]|nr:hypothetical protein [Actinomycetota bacterium]